MKPTVTRRGRPPLGSAATKSESILVRLGLQEKQAFADAAGLAGLPLTVWLRERCRKVAAKELQAAGRDVAFLN